MAGLKLHKNVDGSNQFFGIGPDTKKKAEANYNYDVIRYTGSVGVSPDPERLAPDLFHHMAGDRIRNGPVTTLLQIKTVFPAAAPAIRSKGEERL